VFGTLALMTDNPKEAEPTPPFSVVAVDVVNISEACVYVDGTPPLIPSSLHQGRDMRCAGTGEWPGDCPCTGALGKFRLQQIGRCQASASHARRG